MHSLFRVMRVMSIGVFAAISVGLSTHALDARFVFEDLPSIGTSGGTAFSRECPDNHVLTGIRYRSGFLLDAVGIKCRPVKSDGTLGAEISWGGMVGGSGGTSGSVSCPSNAVIVEQGGKGGPAVGIHTLKMGCYSWIPSAKKWGLPGFPRIYVIGSTTTFLYHACSEHTQPATGIKGKQGDFVDSFRLHCSTP